MKIQAVATAHCVKCDQDYLLLDSKDYWFDVIQTGYPKISGCKQCKGKTFSLRCEYEYRESGDVRHIDVAHRCSSCGRTERLFETDIKYGGTDHLVTLPLTPCKNPKILYDLQELSLYAERRDLSRVVEFLASEHGCYFVVWVRRENKWVKCELPGEEAAALILQEPSPRGSVSFLMIYATPNRLDVPDSAVNTAEKEAVFWKRNEIVRISSPMNIVVNGSISNQPALLYYIRFSGDIVDDGKITKKSVGFQSLTSSLLAWLDSEFVSWRGPRCFDNATEHRRIFGDRFILKAGTSPESEE
jgi:hypothetical protein